MKNFKKAQIGATLTWVAAFLIIFFIMFLFVAMTSILVGQKKIPVVSWIFGTDENIIDIEDSEGSLGYQRKLMAVLNSPVEVEGKIIDIKDLIWLWHSNKSKYEEVFNEEVVDTLNGFEDEFVHSKTENLRLRGFELLIYSKKHVEGEMPEELIRIPSNRFKTDSGSCVSDVHGCVDLAGIYVPVSETNTVYAILWASQKAKEK